VIGFAKTAEGYAIFDGDPLAPKALKLGLYATKVYRGIRKEEGKDPVQIYEASAKPTIHFTSPVVNVEVLKEIVAALPTDPGI
jgi:hypothetical protein